MKGLILLISILLLVAAPVVDGQLGYFCVGDNTIHNWTLDSEVHTLEDFCPYGCNPDNGICYNQSSGSDFAFAMIFIWFGIALLSIYISMNIDRKTHGLLQILFLVLTLVSIWNMLGSAYASVDMLNVNSYDSILEVNTAIWVWVGVFIMFYILLFFLLYIFGILKDIVKRRKIRKKGDLINDSMGMS